MKKKLFGLLAGLTCSVSLLSGCNLFGTDMERYYETVVAKAGKYEINKEELINGYYNYGQNLVSEQGYSTSKAMKETMEMLLQRKMLLGYIKSEAAKEVDNGILPENYFFELTNSEYNAAVHEAWDFIDGEIKTLVIEKYDDPAEVFKDEEAQTPELAGSKTAFEQKIEVVGDKIKLVTDEFEDDDEKLSVHDYTKPDFIEESVIDEVWDEYIEGLKDNQYFKKYKDKSQKAILKREIDRVFKTSLENAYLTKLQNSYSATAGTQDGFLTAATTQKILDKYTAMYKANMEEYNIDPAAFYTNVTNTSTRNNYVYFGDSESIIEVQHILVKFANDESTYQDDPYLTDEENKKAKEDLNTIHNTLAKQRDADGNETGNTLSVYELRNTVIQNIIDFADGTYLKGSEEYANYVTTEFNKLMYMYNEDGGILNSQFDYAIGSNGTTAMVEEFTNAAIELYEQGYEGAVSDIIESTYGYHIVIYTNKLTNIDLGALSVDMLASMKLTSTTTAEDNMLEYIYSLVKADDYTTYESNLLATLEAGKTYTYYKSNYKDLLED